MKSTKMFTILVLALGLMVWPASVAEGRQYLTVNGQRVRSITLELGQSCTVEVVSDDSKPYVDYVGFDNGLVLGDFSHLRTMRAAGNLATVHDYNQPTFYGYRVTASGEKPYTPFPGVHFVFRYQAQQVGETDVKLYDKTLTSELHSVNITVIPLVPEPMGTAFTYQGSLNDAGNPADGLYDFRFMLYSKPWGIQEGNTIDINDLDVIDGQFVVELDFGSGIFAGDARWLEIGVRPGELEDPNVYTVLTPRQEVTPTPYAIYAETAGGDNDWRVSGDDMYSISSGNVGIGTTSPGEKLDVNGNINVNSVYKIGGSTVLSVTDINNTLVGIGAGANNTGDYSTFVGRDAGYNNQGTFNTFLGSYAGYRNTTGYRNTFLGLSAGSRNTEGYRNTFVGNGAGSSNTTGNYNTFSGNGAGSSNTTGNCNTFLGYYAGYRNSTGTNNVFIGYKAGYDAIGSNKLYIANNRFGTLIYGDFSTGNVGIGTTSPQDMLHVWRDTIGSPGIRITNADVQGGDYALRVGGSNSAVGPGNFAIYDHNASATRLVIDSSGKVALRVLEITGGSDISEQFEVSDEGGKVKLGMVVCIDAANSGSLVVSKESYDRTVAGIVSGAGGVKTGMLMGQKGTKADGEHPVALTGRVYCWADASNGSIQAGDLLTTSDMAGHAMKVTDYTKAQGAILGKAMSSLESGKGLVLVLVSLQ